MSRHRGLATLVVPVALVCAGCTRSSSGPPGGGGAATASTGGAGIAALYTAHARDAWTVCSGTVERLLPDDTRPPRHERFIVRVDGADGRTILVAHNIDLAPRVPVRAGDTVELRGEYEWNPEGGVLHETHHAMRPADAPGGYVRRAGVTYR